MTSTLTLTPAREDLIQSRNFIGGTWCEGADGRRFDVLDPADDSLVVQVVDSGEADAKAAVDAASAAFPAWRDTPARQRAQLLKRWHAAIIANQEDLARLISREQGKPLAEGRGEVLYAASYVEWFAGEAVRAYGDLIPAAVGGRRMSVVKEPVGVVAAVTPWNFPAAMIARKIAPALAAGCTVVCKPAEDTPLTSLALVRLAEEAGLPAGTLNIVTASRDTTPTVVGQWLADARVRKITFTGSTPVGKHLARESAATLKKLSLELGGNAPYIVFEDADLDAAVEGLMAGKFRNGGQTCVSPNRVFVHDAVHDAFVAKLAERMSKLTVGPATRPDALIGPMINARAVEKILRHIQDALDKGARLVLGNTQALEQLGPNYVMPALITGATTDMALAHEETFGPVVPVFRFASEAEVVEIANATPYGLAAYFYSNDMDRVWRVAAALESGIVAINEGAFASEAAPFGGIKDSGYGREGSRYGLDEYMHTKYLCQGNLKR
ncbi:NAD-dependent succinate-semialdehyde dehydrogenase [Denitromonas iodatirespirans]|uniref:NAD-dependent succinate-semialdehyde dehydrogenase n=1 Tax=Denitromonas iodatirespirans TaxID=2795389 RepID=A0A944HCZ8_DENI1|nr:NAD-dependent succinate-semialdehyde dehydrogenase [Denitromonas iodatirespirans]MBT0961616.1 NAD-dependent succinate-semialdehyde dehydrogenase [Denitromonas iodatirespirans]